MLCFRCGSYNSDEAQKCTVCGQEFVDRGGRAVGPVKKQPTTSSHQALIFAPGETVKQIVVAVNGDRVTELDETFAVVLSAPVNTSCQRMPSRVTRMRLRGLFPAGAPQPYSRAATAIRRRLFLMVGLLGF